MSLVREKISTDPGGTGDGGDVSGNVSEWKKGEKPMFDGREFIWWLIHKSFG